MTMSEQAAPTNEADNRESSTPPARMAGRTRRRIAFAALALACVSAGLAGALYGTYRYLRYIPSCSQPCKDLGMELDPKESKPRDPVYRPKCNPLELRLELAKNEMKTNTPNALWYKLTLKNVSCLRLGNLEGAAFLTNERWGYYGVRYGYWIKFLDAKGVDSSAPAKDGSSDFFMEDNDRDQFTKVIPYEDDRSGDGAILRNPDFGLDENWEFHLDPGKSITTLGSKYGPHVIMRASAMTPDGWMQDGWSRTNVDMGKNRAPAAPPGFRVYDAPFKKPGTYRLQAVFDHPMVKVHRINPNCESLSKKSLSLLNWIDPYVPGHLVPDWYSSEWYHVHVESPSVELTVKP